MKPLQRDLPKPSTTWGTWPMSGKGYRRIRSRPPGGIRWPPPLDMRMRKHISRSSTSVDEVSRWIMSSRCVTSSTRPRQVPSWEPRGSAHDGWPGMRSRWITWRRGGGSRKRASAGDPEAHCNLGVLHERGLGVPEDLVKAADWYSRSAGQGYAVARFNLGFMKLHGKEVPGDVPGALELIREAAEGGTVEAQHCLGRLYLEGHGVDPDPSQAAIWLARAADAGHIDAQESLRLLYERGTGVPKDIDKAVFFYESARRGGSNSALTRLTNLKLGTGGGMLDSSLLDPGAR